MIGCTLDGCPQYGRFYDQHAIASLATPGFHGTDRRTVPGLVPPPRPTGIPDQFEMTGLLEEFEAAVIARVHAFRDLEQHRDQHATLYRAFTDARDKATTLRIRIVHRMPAQGT